ncbi:MAG: LysM domain [Verrucomicrobiota bacterium]|jgi:LysM repeat protein
MKTSSLPVFFAIAAAHAVALGLVYVATSGESKTKHADVASSPSKTEIVKPGIEPVKLNTETKVAVAKPEAPQYEVYKVKAGDNLSKIAKERKMSVAALAKANKLTTTASLQVNQRLIIPMN